MPKMSLSRDWDSMLELRRLVELTGAVKCRPGAELEPERERSLQRAGPGREPARRVGHLDVLAAGGQADRE